MVMDFLAAMHVQTTSCTLGVLVVCTLSHPKYEVAVCACLPASVVL